MNDIREKLNNFLLFEGGMGSLLLGKGLRAGEKPEKWNISQPEIITAVHCDYINAGANIIKTNTFGANSLKFGDELESVIMSAVECAKLARKRTNSDAYIALDVGPLGKLLKPLGELDFEDAVEIFAKTVRIGVKAGVDLVLLETFTDSLETKSAVLAVKENCDLPLFVTNAYEQSGKLLTGASPAVMVAMLEGLGVDALGDRKSVV